MLIFPIPPSVMTICEKWLFKMKRRVFSGYDENRHRLLDSFWICDVVVDMRVG